MFAASKTASVSGGYQISRSLRFNSADSNTLTRTPATAGSRTTYSLSFWVKNPFTSGSDNPVWGQYSIARESLAFQGFSYAHNPIQWIPFTGFEFRTTQAFRDDSAWYHIVAVGDSTNATAGDRARLYVNGVRVTAFDLSSTITQNAQTGQLNTAVLHYIGKTWSSDGAVPRFYLTEFNFIDGQALTPSSFGETNAQTGVWQPKAYSGSYGTNGFYLNFSDNSNTTAATLGKDYSGNGNNWTPNNFSVTAGAGNDSLVDSPTSYGTDTGVGGEVRGNYSTMNPLDNYNTNAAVAFTFANGNLDVSRSNQSWASSRSTMAMSSGKWYAEMTVTASTAGTLNAMFGIAKPDFTINDYFGGQSGGYGYNAANGQKYNGGSGASYGATFTTNDVIGVAYDADAGSLVFYKNGTSQGTAYTGLSGTFCFAIGLFPQTSGSITATLNCGQRPFAYTAPSGFKALCTQNLPTPTIGATTATQAGKYFNPVTYTGTGSSNSVTGVGFQPDWTWIKSRSNGAYHHRLVDAVRGVTKEIYSNLTNAEGTDSVGLTAFGSDGFTVGSSNEYNASGSTFVAWNWKANGSGSTNTSGSITSTVSANTTSGFSVVTYTGTGANATVGHGLGVAPSMVIVKRRDGGSDNWQGYHISLGKNYTIKLNTTQAQENLSDYWGTGGVTSTVFGINGTYSGINANTGTYVAYCFAEVAGYSKAFSYTGNGSADGAFVYTGFRPAYVLIKRTTGAFDWWIMDATRSPANAVRARLYANDSAAESSNDDRLDLLSNGFKFRNNDGGYNASGEPYIGIAFASVPFKFSLAR